MTSEETAKEIDRIIYAQQPKEQILQNLASIVKVGDMVDDFLHKSGLNFHGFISGPGIKHWRSMDCGLQLVCEPSGRIQLIRRNQSTQNGINFDECSLTTNVLVLPSSRGDGSIGYAREYET